MDTASQPAPIGKMLLKDKISVITGSNRGIGKAILEIFAKNGCNIFACIRKENAAFQVYLQTLEREFGVWIKPVFMDLEDEDSIKAAIKSIMAESVKIDILVNNAGVASGGLFQMTSVKEMKRIFEINFFAQIQFTQGIARLMMRHKAGSIINLSSTAAYLPDPGTLAYGSSKAAFSRATQSLATELGAYNIRVNALAPGVTRTDMYDQMSVTARDALINASALKRVGEPDDVAGAALFLASDLSTFVTGQILRVDGGTK